MKFSRESVINYKEGEELIIAVREYFITRLPQLTIVVPLYLGWWFVFVFFLRWGAIGGAAWILGMLLILGYGLRIWMMWKNDCCLVTTQRLIDIQKRGLFDTTVRTVSWNSVSDVQYNTHGIFASLFGYGTITVVIKDAEPIVLQHVYQPSEIRDILSQHVQTHK